MMKWYILLLTEIVICANVKGMVRELGERERLLAEAEPDDNIFIAEINTAHGNCAVIQSDIEALCLAQDAATNITSNTLLEFGDGECFLTFTCNVAYAESDAIQGLIDDIISLEHDSAVISEAIPSLDTELWNLDRVDSVDLNFNKVFDPRFTGNGVNVYIVDTGILPTHEQFAGRATLGAQFVSESSPTDGNGHGTHCAGTAVGANVGVAKNANLIGVKVLSASGAGSTTNVISGMEWAVQNQKKNFGGESAVISMSLGGGGNKMMDNAARAAAKAGHIVVVAAGNSNIDACDFSPAGAGGSAKSGGVITVGSTDKKDRRSSFSNYGSCVDIFAPGTSIASAWIGGNNKYKTISGTSMATPLVAGVAATMLEKHNKNKNAAQSELLAIVSVNKISDTKSGSPNEFVHTIKTISVGSPTSQPTRPPTLPGPVMYVDGFRLEESGNWYNAKFAPPASSSKTVQGPIAIAEDLCGPWTKNQFKDTIVLIERGDCLFYSKGIGLQNAGAKAVILTQDSGAVPFEPSYYGNDVDMVVPMAMVSRATGQQLALHVTKTMTWGLDPTLDGAPTSPPVSEGSPTPPPSVPALNPQPKFDKYFLPNVKPGKMCEINSRTQYIKKKQKSRNAESCAKACLTRKNCVAINFREDENENWKCSLIKVCTLTDSVEGFVAYEYTKPVLTFAPTPSGLSPYDRYFKGNDSPGDKCKQTNSALISKKVRATLDQCAQLCAENTECLYMNYNERDQECDLVKKCTKRSSLKILAYKKIDSAEGNSGGGNNTYGEGIIFQTYFGQNSNKLSDTNKHCRQVFEDEVLDYELSLTKEDCAKRCVKSAQCTHMNYDLNRRGPCTLLKKCNIVEGQTNIESFLSNDVADSLTVDENDDGATTTNDQPSDMPLGKLFG